MKKERKTVLLEIAQFFVAVLILNEENWQDLKPEIRTVVLCAIIVSSFVVA